MIDNPISCAPRVDRFLAVTKVKPLEPEKPRKTVKEKREQERKMVACLKNVKKIELDI